jgi:hypothetical protein
MFGLFKKKHLKPAKAYSSSDPNKAFQLLHVQTAHMIMDAWKARNGEYDFLAHHSVVAAFHSLIVALRTHFRPASKHVVEDDSLYARLLDTSRFKASFALVDEFVANLTKADARDDTSLVIFATGAYAPSEVRNAFAHIMVNPPDGATPVHAREAFELATAASRSY